MLLEGEELLRLFCVFFMHDCYGGNDLWAECCLFASLVLQVLSLSDTQHCTMLAREMNLGDTGWKNTSPKRVPVLQFTCPQTKEDQYHCYYFLSDTRAASANRHPLPAPARHDQDVNRTQQNEFSSVNLPVFLSPMFTESSFSETSSKPSSFNSSVVAITSFF